VLMRKDAGINSYEDFKGRTRSASRSPGRNPMRLSMQTA